MNDRFSILSSGICKYTYYGKRSDSVKMHKKSIENLSKCLSLKTLSKSSAKKIKQIITNWYIGIKLTHKEQYGSGKHFDKYLIMITLTLPSKQYESDKVIKLKYLNLFLSKLRYHYKNFNYLWVSERQQNGNIHFHLVVDQYMKKEVVQNMWNDTLANGDYINNFQKKHGHRKPPTTKITAQNKMKDCAEYLTKYVTKAEKSEPIEGKLWDCSDLLQKVSRLAFMWKPIYYDLIAVDFARFTMKYFSTDFKELFLIDKGFVSKLFSMDLFFEIESELKQQLSVIFPSLLSKNTALEQKEVSTEWIQLSLSF
jgi:hypothetical protein